MKTQCSIVNLGNIEQDSMRVDAEHYQSRYSDNQAKLTQFGAVPLSELLSQPIVTGHTPSMKVASYYGGNVNFVKTDNLRTFQISGQFTHHLSDAGNRVILKSALQERDLIITIIGATHEIVGRAALVGEDALPANINQNIALIRLDSEFSPEVLTAYFNSRIGKLALWYLSRQTGQVNLNCRELERVLVPTLSRELEVGIKSTYKYAESLREESNRKLAEAEALLLSEVGLADWQPNRPTESVRSFSEAWGAGRMDAEYFQPKYDDIVDAIKGYAGGWDTLDNLAWIRKCFEVGSAQYLNEGIPFVRVSNLTPYEITEEKHISKDLYSLLEHHQPEQGEILLSKDGTPGIAHYLDELPHKMIPSGGILRLKRKSDRVNDEYLTLALNSMPTQQQVNRDVGGSVILHWRPDQVERTLIPILPKAKQVEIQRKVAESAALRRQSRELLEYARRAVEIAIEQDERTAMEWLDRALAQDEANGPAKRGFNNEAIDRLVALRQEIFDGKPLPGNSADFIREAREERSKQMDNWR